VEGYQHSQSLFTQTGQSDTENSQSEQEIKFDIQRPQAEVRLINNDDV
jgi:hypothetical protein